VIGLAGVALMFWTELGKAAGDSSAWLGLLFTFGAVLLSSVGSLAASRNRRHGLPFWPALGYGMLYGAAVTAIVALAQGQTFALPSVTSWWLALFYLALAGSVLTFACFLTLQERIGPGRAGAIGVLTPLLAVTVSVIFEGFRPDAVTVAGAAMAVAGNVLMLRRAGG
jgi:drug/metabolite transporter (DMT)-like permease